MEALCSGCVYIHTPPKHNTLESGLGPPLNFIPLASLSKDQITNSEVEWSTLFFYFPCCQTHCFLISWYSVCCIYCRDGHRCFIVFNHLHHRTVYLIFHAVLQLFSGGKNKCLTLLVCLHSIFYLPKIIELLAIKCT